MNMNELIKVNPGGIAILDEETAQKIADFEAIAKKVKEEEEALKTAILAEMKEKGVIKIETVHLVINYIEATMRETFDAKALKKDFPDIYDGYAKLTPVKESVRIKVR